MGNRSSSSSSDDEEERRASSIINRYVNVILRDQLRESKLPGAVVKTLQDGSLKGLKDSYLSFRRE